MDFDTLIQPYSEDGRTASGQIKWLLKNGYSIVSVDYAMSAVYKRMELGETFLDGDALDQELRRVAKEHHETDLVESMKKRISDVEQNLDTEWSALSKLAKIWQVMTGKA